MSDDFVDNTLSQIRKESEEIEVDEEKPIFIMMCGLPGAGKSTLAAKLAEEYGAELISTDEICMQLYHTVRIESSKKQKVYHMADQKIQKAIEEDKSIVYDSENISLKRRKAVLTDCLKQKYRIVCKLLAVPYEICLKQDRQRKNCVGDKTMRSMISSFTVPYYYEGFEKIDVIYHPDTIFETAENFLKKYDDYDQDNPHHTLTLGEHCQKCAELLRQRGADEEMIFAGKLHDCGKPFCRTYIKPNGIKDKYAHYYGHEHVGSYLVLFYEGATIFTAMLIAWHMRPGMVWKSGIYKKDYRYLGKELYEKILLFHQCDRDAH